MPTPPPKPSKSRKTSSVTRNTTPQQWAWEFLRRNPDYREAYDAISELTESQRAALAMLSNPSYDEDELDWQSVVELRLDFFYRSWLIGAKESHIYLKDYLLFAREDRKEAPQLYGNSLRELGVQISPKYLLRTYGVTDWFDHKISYLDINTLNVWRVRNVFEYSLEPTGEVDAQLESLEEGTSAEWPFSIGENTTTTVHEQDARKRRDPEDHFGLYGESTGNNGKVFRRKQWSQSSDPASRNFYGNDEFWDSDSSVRVTFDVALPLAEQIASAEEALRNHQALLKDAGFVGVTAEVPNRAGILKTYLDVLDLLDQGKTHIEIAIALKGLKKEINLTFDDDPRGREEVVYMDKREPERVFNKEHTASVRQQIGRAKQMRDVGYRALAYAKNGG